MIMKMLLQKGATRVVVYYETWRLADLFFFYYPLFSYETFYEETESEYPEQVSRFVFNSASFGFHTAINESVYAAYRNLPYYQMAQQELIQNPTVFSKVEVSTASFYITSYGELFKSICL